MDYYYRYSYFIINERLDFKYILFVISFQSNLLAIVIQYTILNFQFIISSSIPCSKLFLSSSCILFFILGYDAAWSACI